MSATKLSGYKSMSSLGLAREVAEILNGTFFFTGAQTPGANGNVTVAHGLGVAPTFYAAGILGDSANLCTVQSVDATNVTLRVSVAATNADVTSGAQQVWIIASSKL